MPLDNSGTQSFRARRLKCKAIAGTPGRISNEQTVPQSTFVNYKLGRMPYLVQPSSGPVTTDAGCCGSAPACPYQNSSIAYRNETLAYMETNYPDYIPAAELSPDYLILVIELSPSIGSAQVQDCINTFGEFVPNSLPFTYVNNDVADKTLIFTVVPTFLFVFGNINIVICDSNLEITCVNCNIPVSPFEPAIAVITPADYNTYTGNELDLTYPNLIFRIYSICGNFNGVTRLTNGGTIDVAVTDDDENQYILDPEIYGLYLNIIKTNIRIPGLSEDPPPTPEDVTAAIEALNNPETPILAEGTMVDSCAQEQPIVMYESFFNRSINYRSGNKKFMKSLKGKVPDKSLFSWFKKA